jgi:hypothetical protein
MPARIYLLIVAAALASAATLHADPRISQLIDDEINAKLRAEHVVSAGRADDATLVRRIYLDILGRPPSGTETTGFLDDQTEDKVHLLIRTLRLYPESAAHWRRVIAGWLQAGDSRSGHDYLLQYLATAVGENRGWDQIVRDLLDPNENAKERGASAYLSRFLSGKDNSAGRDSATIAVASAFFGAQLQCARCHDHPTVKEWKKARFDGMRAFFDRSGAKSGGLVRILESIAQSKVKPSFLDGKEFDPADKPLTRLANHAVSPEATHFKRAIVNRVWKQLMGRGLVEPADMIHDGNPASHPKLFDALADDFAANGFNFDRLISSIMHTEAYLRSARWTGPADQKPSESLFAVAPLRPLSGPQMAWSVAVATGYANTIPVDLRTEGLYLPRGKGLPLALRYKWESTEEYGKFADIFREKGDPSTAAHAIYLAFDPLMKKALEPTAGLLVGDLAEMQDTDEAVKWAHLSILNRPPGADEFVAAIAHMKAAKTRSAGCQDLVWALIASAEFRFNH